MGSARSPRRRSPSPDDAYSSKRRKHHSSYSATGGHSSARDPSPTRRHHDSPSTSSRADADRHRGDRRDAHRDRDRDRDKEREREREREREHHDRRSSWRDRSAERNRERPHGRDRLNSRFDRTRDDVRPRDRPRSPELPPPSPAATNGATGVQAAADDSRRGVAPISDSSPSAPISTASTSNAATGSSTANATVSASSAASASKPDEALTEEEKKKKAKRERLEAWKKAQEAKKALEEARARAQSVAAQFSGRATDGAGTAGATGLPSKPGEAPTSIKATGLKTTARTDFLKRRTGSAAAMDDTAEPTRKLTKLSLPPVDPLLKPGSGGEVGNASDLEGEDEEEDDPMAGLAALNDDDKMEEDEVDPLDAYMNGIQDEVKKVNEADKVRFGKAGNTKEVVGRDEGEADNEEEAPEIDELDKVGMKAEDILALAAKRIKKKELAAVDHSKVDYEPFHKAFYHPPPEVSDMTDDQAAVLRLEMDAITTRGKEPPKPITKWSHCGLPASCLDVIKRNGWEKPTSIQAQAIPAIMSGRDVIGVAKTGSGKTIAFLLPMLRHIKDQRPLDSQEGPIAMIMTPTRELAVQIHRDCKPFAKVLGLRAVCAYGGSPISEQIADMKRTAEIVVCTPGRMIDLLTANSGRVTNLRRVTYMVLDEADRMFDMGFEPQVMKIINNVRPDRQTVMFSATFPRQMEGLARKLLRHKPLEITVGGRSVVAAEIEQIVEVREEETKFNRLLEILGQTYNEDEDARTLIFVDRQEAADNLLRDLMRKGYPCMSLHGGKDQVDRDSTISDFKAGIVPILTATSVAARGLDVKQLKLVINYDAPNHLEDYVHRAGRTGRAGNQGTCVTFITPEQERYSLDILKALTASGAVVPPELMAMTEAFKEKVKAGKAHQAGSGFGGKGLERLEKDRDATLRAQRSAYGEGGEDEKEEQAEVTQGLDDIVVQKGRAPADAELGKINDLKVEIKKGAAPESVKNDKAKAQNSATNNAALAALEAAKAAAEKAGVASVDVNKAQSVLAKLNADLQRMKAAKAAEAAGGASGEEREREREREREQQQPRKPRDPDATDYHAIVPINDFPQKARWRVTNKETMVHLIDLTGASVTLKGVFYAAGKEPGAEDPPKLQLLIESNDEHRVEHTVREIKRMLIEATQAALEAEQRNPGGSGAPGRYSVV